MPAKRLSMRNIKEVLRLKWGKGMSNRKSNRSVVPVWATFGKLSLIGMVRLWGHW